MADPRSISPEIPVRPPRLSITLKTGRFKSDFTFRKPCLHILPGHTRGISSLKFQPQGKILASAGADGFIFLWSYKEGRQIRALLGHKLGIDEIAWSHDGHWLASCSDDTTVKIWDIEVGRPIRTLKEHTVAAFSCAWNVQGNFIASGGEDGRVIFWDARCGRSVRNIVCHESYPVSSLEFHKDSSILLSASTDGLCRIWEVAVGHCLKTLVEQTNPAVGSARFSPNGRYILVSHINGTIKLWDYLRTKEKRVFQGHTNSMYCIPAGFLSSPGGGGGVSVVSGSEDHSVYVWDLNSRKIQQTLVGHSDAVIATACHPTERIIASGGLQKDRDVRVWSV